MKQALEIESRIISTFKTTYFILLLMNKNLFIFMIVIMSSSIAYGHGLKKTTVNQISSEREKKFFEYFITELDARTNISINEKDGFRYIESDGLADHTTGKFPNSGNPNAISEQAYKFRMALKPEKKNTSTPSGHSTFGVAINGVPFDPGTAEYWNNDRSSNWNIEALTGGMNLGLDRNNAHVQPNGAYHYHSTPVGILEKYNYRDKPVLLGYAADGFPVYGSYGYKNATNSSSQLIELRPSYQIRQGSRSDGPRGRYDGTYTRDYEYVDGSGNLDKCNGRTGVTPEYPNGTYYYVITDQFPFIPRCWMGTADSSFKKGPGIGQQGDRSGRQRPERQGRGGPRPPEEAISACSGLNTGSSCSFRSPRGSVNGTCRNIESTKACVPRGR